MNRARAQNQNIRPLKIIVLNLMPTKIATETQLARVLANSPLQVEMNLTITVNHQRSVTLMGRRGLTKMATAALPQRSLRNPRIRRMDRQGQQRQYRGHQRMNPQRIKTIKPGRTPLMVRS